MVIKLFVCSLITALGGLVKGNASTDRKHNELLRWVGAQAGGQAAAIIRSLVLGDVHEDALVAGSNLLDSGNLRVCAEGLYQRLAG